MVLGLQIWEFAIFPVMHCSKFGIFLTDSHKIKILNDVTSFHDSFQMFYELNWTEKLM